jgi:hypothetical protein
MLQVANEPSDGVATAAGFQIDAHPPIADIHAQSLPNVEINRLYLRYSIDDFWDTPQPKRPPRSEQLFQEERQIVDRSAELDDDWSTAYGCTISMLVQSLPRNCLLFAQIDEPPITPHNSPYEL